MSKTFATFINPAIDSGERLAEEIVSAEDKIEGEYDEVTRRMIFLDGFLVVAFKAPTNIGFDFERNAMFEDRLRVIRCAIAAAYELGKEHGKAGK